MWNRRNQKIRVFEVITGWETPVRAAEAVTSVWIHKIQLVETCFQVWAIDKKNSMSKKKNKCAPGGHGDAKPRKKKKKKERKPWGIVTKKYKQGWKQFFPLEYICTNKIWWLVRVGLTKAKKNLS
jgi:hypothetical protein